MIFLLMASLLAVSRAASAEAKRSLRWRFAPHGGTFVLTLASFSFTDPWPLYCVFGAVLTELAAWWLRARADSLHHLAEQARRGALLMDAFGATGEPPDAVDVRLALPASVLAAAEQQVDSNYYAS